MGRGRIFFFIYRKFFFFILLLFKNLEWFQNRKDDLQKFRSLKMHEVKSRIWWFHASSVGELEALIPVMDQAVKLSNIRLVVTVFSHSARPALERLKTRYQVWDIVYFGYSPVEGSWYDAFLKVRPEKFITTKYEAWPEIWGSATLLDFRIWILGAKLRSSLKIAAFIQAILFGRLPKLGMLSFSVDDLPALEKKFSKADLILKHSHDPRWQRVIEKLQETQAHVEIPSDLKQLLLNLPKPVRLFGSVWPEDLQAIRQNKWGAYLDGSWVLVPHRLDPLFLKKIEVESRELRKDYQIWSQLKQSPSWMSLAGQSSQSILVIDEMGILLSLYAYADWVWVGGGYSHGVHSTIEPGVFSLPMVCGIKRAEMFSEIHYFESRGQLKKLDNPDWVNLSPTYEKKPRIPHQEYLNKYSKSALEVFALIEMPL